MKTEFEQERVDIFMIKGTVWDEIPPRQKIDYLIRKLNAFQRMDSDCENASTIEDVIDGLVGTGDLSIEEGAAALDLYNSHVCISATNTTFDNENSIWSNRITIQIGTKNLNENQIEQIINTVNLIGDDKELTDKFLIYISTLGV